MISETLSLCDVTTVQALPIIFDSSLLFPEPEPGYLTPSICRESKSDTVATVPASRATFNDNDRLAGMTVCWALQFSGQPEIEDVIHGDMMIAAGNVVCEQSKKVTIQ